MNKKQFLLVLGVLVALVLAFRLWDIQIANGTQGRVVVDRSGRRTCGIGAVLHDLGVPAQPGVNVGIVDARCQDLDQHLAWTWCRNRHVGAVGKFVVSAMAR